MKKTFACVLLVGLIGCGVAERTHSVADVTKPQTITLNKESSQGGIVSFIVVAQGHLDGAAEIVLIHADSGKPYRTEHLSGDVDFRWGGEWYSDSAKIEYKPSSVKSGHLSLQYRFEEIDTW